MKKNKILFGIAVAFGVTGLSVTSLHAQNVGIGTPTPVTKLHVSTNVAADGIQIDNTAANGDPILQYRLNGVSLITMGVDDSDADKFKIGTTAITTNTRVTIQTNGYIGIGITAPLHHVHGTGLRAGDYYAWFENTSGTGSSLAGYVNGTYNGLGGITNNVDGLGNYGVHLPATGDGWAMWGTSNSSNGIGVRGTIPTTGAWLGYGGYFTGGLGYANGLYNLSDARMKKNITNLTGSLAKIQQLRGVTYNYNTEDYGAYLGDDNRTYIGLVAQEVAQVFPEATAQKNLTGYSESTAGATADMDKVVREQVTVVDYTALVPVLIEAIKEQQAQIQQLEQRIQVLESHH